MGIFRQVAGAALAGPLGAAAADSKGGKKRSSSSGGDSPGDQGYGPPDPSDSDSSDAGSDGGFGNYAKRVGKSIARSYLGGPKRSSSL